MTIGATDTGSDIPTTITTTVVNGNGGTLVAMSNVSFNIGPTNFFELNLYNLSFGQNISGFDAVTVAITMTSTIQTSVSYTTNYYFTPTLNEINTTALLSTLATVRTNTANGGQANTAYPIYVTNPTVS
jgi:hypothetical protein